MKRTHAVLAVAAAAFLAAPAFAQSSSCFVDSSNLQMTCPSTSILGAGPVISSNGSVISSGTGLVVTPGAPSYVTVMPSNSVALATVPGNRILPGAATVQAQQTTVLGAGPAVLSAPATSGSQTIVTTYWVNVPANVMNRADFQRWTQLKP